MILNDFFKKKNFLGGTISLFFQNLKIIFRKKGAIRQGAQKDRIRYKKVIF